MVTPACFVTEIVAYSPCTLSSQCSNLRIRMLIFKASRFYPLQRLAQHNLQIPYFDLHPTKPSLVHINTMIIYAYIHSSGYIACLVAMIVVYFLLPISKLTEHSPYIPCLAFYRTELSLVKFLCVVSYDSFIYKMIYR